MAVGLSSVSIFLAAMLCLPSASFEISWNKPPEKPVQEGAFTVIGDLGMTGQVILVNQYQWRALTDAKLEKFFYAALLWGKSPFKVIEDAQLILKRGK